MRVDSHSCEHFHACLRPKLATDSTDLVTYTHLALIALFALVVIVGIVVGIRLARRRRQGLKEIEADNTLVGKSPPGPPSETASESRPGEKESVRG